MGSQPLSTKMVDVQAMPTMWPDSMQALVRTDRRVKIAAPRDTGIMDGQLFSKEHTFADSNHFQELLDQSISGDNHQSSLARLYENRQNNAVSLLRQQLETLTVQRLEAERRQVQILEESVYDPLFAVDGCGLCGESPPIYDQYVGDDGPQSWSSIPGSESCLSEMEGDNPAEYWRDRARGFAKLLSDSIHREEILTEKLNEFTSMPASAQPLEELRQHLDRFDNFLRFTLRKAPVVAAHQDNELRYRFIYNAFPSLTEEEVIGKTDIEIFKGAGVLELMDFKREVLRKGLPEKREISFDTDLFGEKTFLIAVEPVLSRAGESMGINYVAMDISEQVDKRERLARIREQVAVQKAMETELHKTIHITEETMRAKQMLATMSHEIRSPLSGVVSMAEVLATTKLDPEQRQLVEVMMSSGDLVLQLINDILDLSKVESGAMKFEAKKFRPREVVKHVLQMALASMQNKQLVLEGRIYDNVPLEVIGDVLRIRQVFTNLVSNAIKFTHEGSVTINVRVAPSPIPTEIPKSEGQVPITSSETASSHEGSFPTGYPLPDFIALNVFQEEVTENLHNAAEIEEGSSLPVLAGSVAPQISSLQSDKEAEENGTVWLQCDICDTGIGIPETALPSLFEKYTQASTTHARKYGGTGLGLAICKNLVELMGGSLKVTSEENVGSTFTFKLPIQVARERSVSTRHLSEEVYNIMTNEAKLDGAAENLASTKEVGYFHFTSKVTLFSQPQSLTSSSRSSSTLMANSITSSSAASNSDQYFSEATSPHQPSGPTNKSLKEAERVLSSQTTSSLGPFQNSSPEFMGVDSLASDSIGYIPGLSISHCQSLGQLKVSQQGQVPSWSFPKAWSSTGWGPSRKGRKSQERRAPSVPPAPSSSTATAPTTKRPQRPTKILLAEDNKVNVMVAQSMLKRLGHKLEVVSNGADALQALQQKTFDLILMDVCMPVMDGLEATRRIRSYEQTGSWEAQDESEVKRTTEASSNEFSSKVQFGETPPCQSSRKRVPIIAMTANALADNMLECYKHGMDSFIAKPVTFTKLEQVLKQFVPCLNRTGSSSQPFMGFP